MFLNFLDKICIIYLHSSYGGGHLGRGGADADDGGGGAGRGGLGWGTGTMCPAMDIKIYHPYI